MYALSMDGERVSEVLFDSEFGTDYADISPNGRWLAYSSDESGVESIYVQPYPNLDDGRWQVSSDGGTQPVWGPDGQELFYLRNDSGTVMMLSVEDDPSFSPGLPRELFTWERAIGGRGSYDISPDGQRFLVNDQGETAGATSQIIIVENWFEELKRLAPAAE